MKGRRDGERKGRGQREGEDRKKEEQLWDGKKRQHYSLVGVSQQFRGTEAGHLQSQRIKTLTQGMLWRTLVHGRGGLGSALLSLPPSLYQSGPPLWKLPVQVPGVPALVYTA